MVYLVSSGSAMDATIRPVAHGDSLFSKTPGDEEDGACSRQHGYKLVFIKRRQMKITDWLGIKSIKKTAAAV
ncbi:MAG TPA: hypothetical protein PKK59_02555 [Anaerolineaceae bacterium]|nr:hypothetical protein [Anaerolineaceae bacterium]